VRGREEEGGVDVEWTRNPDPGFKISTRFLPSQSHPKREKKKRFKNIEKRLKRLIFGMASTKLQIGHPLGG
jgi:hypothetical protein